MVIIKYSFPYHPHLFVAVCYRKGVWGQSDIVQCEGHFPYMRLTQVRSLASYGSQAHQEWYLSWVLSSEHTGVVQISTSLQANSFWEVKI